MKLFYKNEQVKFSKGRLVLRGLLLILLLIAVPAAYILPQLLVTGDPADYYSEYIFPALSFLPLSISSFFIFSLTEMAVVVGSLALIVLAVAFIIKVIKLAAKSDARHLLHFLYVVGRNLLIIALIAAIIFELMHGINYGRTSVKDRLELDASERSEEDFEQTLLWAYIGMINARRQLGEDYNGVAHMQTNFDTIVYDANCIVSAVSNYYDLGLSPNYIRAKAVSLSSLWSYTYITGMYDPFLCEANINTDYLDILHFPVTVCHEICHAKGYASETDANTIAVISCINSSRPDFQYAGYYYIFMRLISEGVEVGDYVSATDWAMVSRDIAAYNAYHASLETGPVAEFIESFSEDANNAFLESNGQTGGTATYRVSKDIYVEYFCRYIRDYAEDNS